MIVKENKGKFEIWYELVNFLKNGWISGLNLVLDRMVEIYNFGKKCFF